MDDNKRAAALHGAPGMENPATDPFEIWRCPGCEHTITSSVPMERDEVTRLIRNHLGHCEPLRNWIRRLERKASLALEVIRAEDINELHELASAVQFWRDLENPPPVPPGMSAEDAEISRLLMSMHRPAPQKIGHASADSMVSPNEYLEPVAHALEEILEGIRGAMQGGVRQ